MSNAVIPGQAGTSKPKRSKSAPAPAPKAQAKASAPGQAQPAPPTAEAGSADGRWRMIAEEAYLRAERRGFSHGDPIDDWLAAEREVDQRSGRA